MSKWNYVATANKPTRVTHSCVGNITGTEERHLIVAKRTHIEIHHVTSGGGLQLLLDVPINGRISTLDLFRHHGEAHDLIFITTDRYEYCVLEWDAVASGVKTRANGDVSENFGHPTVDGQIVTIDPDCRLIGIHLYDGYFKVIAFDEYLQRHEAYSIRFEELQVLDIKFLYGCTKPTIAVLYQDNKDARHIKTYVVALEKKKFVEGPFSRNDLDNGADLLIPVPSPIGGVLIIGERTIVYCSASSSKEIRTSPSITQAYERIVDDYHYLLGDQNGALRVLEITHKNEKVTGLKTLLLGQTSVASTISYLYNNSNVYIGSSHGDSQLIKLKQEPDAKSSSLEVIKQYDNLGPIVDFCVVDLESQGQVVTCSGVDKDGSLRIVRSGININVQASVDSPCINGMWSLKSATDDMYDTFLVASHPEGTSILEMNIEDKFAEIIIEGFSSEVETLFCRGVVYNQLLQVTSKSVKLVCSKSRKIRNEWFAPTDTSISVATANATQVLLATGNKNLFYLDIGEGVLKEVKKAELEWEISCLDITPIGEDPNHSCLAAVGMWNDSRLRIFSLPGLDLVTKECLVTEDEERLGRHVMSRSVLLCSFDAVSYLLCGLGDGHLVKFVLNMNTGELSDRMEVSVGTQQITLRTLSSKNAPLVFAVSDRPAVIYISNKKLFCIDVNLKNVHHVCQFNSASCLDSLAIAKEGELAIGTIDGAQKLISRTIPLGGGYARRICHQEQTRTFALCIIMYNESRSEEDQMHAIRLLNDESFDFISTYALDRYEWACSILSCSFSYDTKVYYCVGTGFVIPEECEPSKGRILILEVEHGKLKLVSEIETNGSVYSLNAFSGKLLAAINQDIQLYKWVLRDDGTCGLQPECRHGGHTVAVDVKTRGDFIVVGDLRKSMSLLIYKHENEAIEELANDYNESRMSAIEMLADDVYIGAMDTCCLFTLWRNIEGENPSFLEIVGLYNLGGIVNRFRQGSLAMRPPDSGFGGIPTPTVLFGTVDGVVGVVASLPEDLYCLLEKLQENLRRLKSSIGGLRHDLFRSIYDQNMKLAAEAVNFLDGDLIASFVDLCQGEKEGVSKSMSVSVEELMKTVEGLNLTLFGMPI